MGALFDVAKQVEPWLAERGLKRDEIEHGMRLLLGDDWEGISTCELVKRLQENGHAITETMPLFADELEALVRGALKLDDIRHRII